MLRITVLAALTFAALGCTTPHPVTPAQPPSLRAYVEVTLGQPGVPAAFVAGINAGGAVWSSVGVGFATSAQAGLPLCADAWWKTSTVCKIHVDIMIWPKSQIGGYAGLTANHRTQLAQELFGDELISVTAHELGHTIWNSPAHLLPGEVGIMSDPSTYVTTPSAADLRYVKLHTDGALP